MPVIGDGYQPGQSRKAKKKPRYSQAPVRQADQGSAEGRKPAPKPVVRPVFKPPADTRPFAAQQAQAQERVRAARRAAPAPALAQPPIVGTAGTSRARAGEPPMTKEQVANFLRAQTPIARHAREQIVASIRRQVGDAQGQERVARVEALMDQIATDPRLRRTRDAIRHYTDIERQTARPQTRDELKPGPPDHKAGVGFATINLTAAQRLAAAAAAKVAPGLQGATPEQNFVKNAFRDVGTIGTAPFVAGATIASLGKDVVTGHPGEAAERALALGKGVVEGTVKDWSNPGKYLVEHPLLFGLDVTGAGSVVGHTAGAAGRFAKLDRASTVRPPIALGDDLAGGIQERRGSKDLIRREIQRASDATRDPLRDADGNVVMVEQAGRQVPVLKPRTPLEQARLNRKRGDVAASRANSMERLARDEEGKDRKVKGVRGKAARDIVSMVTRGVITSAEHMPQDLTHYLSHVRGQLAQHDLEVASGQTPTIYRHEGEIEEAKRNAALAEKVLRSPKAMAQAQRIVSEGERHGRALVEHDARAASAGLFEGGAEQARRARLVETAVHHMGAKHGTDPRLDKRIADAKKLERRLQARMNFHAKTAADKKIIAQQIEATRQMREGMEARNTERLRDSKGDPLEPDQIEAFLKSRGRDPETVAYLPPNVSRQQFHKQFRPDSRGTLDKPGQIRTGAQASKGAVENSADLIRAAGVRHATTITKARNIDRLVADHGMRHPAVAKAASGRKLTKHEQRVVDRGGYFTGPEAAEAINRAAAQGQRLVAVRAYPGRLDAATQKIIRDDLQGPGAMDTLGQRLLNDRFLTDGELNSGKARNVVLMNEDLVQRLAAHLRPSTSAGKFGQIVNRAFRYAVLPQPRWALGNFFEPLVVRMPGVASGINVFGLAVDVTAANRVIRHMERSGDPAVRAAAQEIKAHQFGGLLFGNRGLTNKRGLEDFPALNATVQKAYGKMVQKLPVTRQLTEISGTLLRGGGKAILAPLDLIFTLNRVGEAGLQRAAFGKAVRRDAQEWTRSWGKTIHLSQQALDDVANGLVNTPTQQRFLDQAHELLGKYEGFSPTMRGVIQGVAPFLPWMLNAARFIYWTMPAHRSAQTAFLVHLNDVVAKDWEETHQGVPPGMGLAIPNGKGGWVDIARYTPYGLGGQLKEGEYRGVVSQILPQTGGAESALLGEDPFGRDLSMSDGEKAGGWDKAGVATNSLAEALTPWLSNIRRLQERGETAYADSTAFSPKSKPGTSHGMSAARRVLDPFRPTYLSGGGSVEGEPETRPASRTAAAPPSRREQMLARRAERLAAHSQANDRRQKMLERRAARLGRSR